MRGGPFTVAEIGAGVEVFDSQGFPHTTVADICQRADVAHKTFFNHFPSKQDLFRELAGLGLESVLLEIETARNALALVGEVAS